MTAVRHSAAWEAGHKALAARNPWATVDHSLWEHKMALANKAAPQQSLAEAHEGAKGGEEKDKEEPSFVPLTAVHTDKVEGDWAHGAPNPKALVHTSDRYVTSGHTVEPPGYILEKEEGEHKEARRRSQQLSESADGDVSEGVKVPGGRVVYMPIRDLAQQEQEHVPQQQPSVRRHRAQAVQFPKSYSKIVEYGDNGWLPFHVPGARHWGRHALSLSTSASPSRAVLPLHNLSKPLCDVCPVSLVDWSVATRRAANRDDLRAGLPPSQQRPCTQGTTHFAAQQPQGYKPRGRARSRRP